MCRATYVFSFSFFFLTCALCTVLMKYSLSLYMIEHGLQRSFTVSRSVSVDQACQSSYLIRRRWNWSRGNVIRYAGKSIGLDKTRDTNPRAVFLLAFSWALRNSLQHSLQHFGEAKVEIEQYHVQGVLSFCWKHCPSGTTTKAKRTLRFSCMNCV